MRSVWPGWTFVPTRTIRSAYAERFFMPERIENSISSVERHVVPARSFSGEPVEGVVALRCDRVRLGVLLGRQVAIDLAVRAEVAADRDGQEAFVVPAHRGRGDQLVEARIAGRELEHA